ncbi:hypothetical protein HispidOSU_018875 [Sigmodon hispidus]
MSSRVVRQRDDLGTPERRGVGRLPCSRQVRAGASFVTRSLGPSAPSSVCSARGVESLVGVSVGRGTARGRGGAAVASRARTAAYRRPRRTRSLPGAPGCDVFREARAGPHWWSALSKRVCGLENLAAMLRLPGSRASTDDKFSAKWLLETVA